jgi:SAM-dependent methyltransferase
MNQPYIHHLTEHDLKYPSILVPLLIDQLRPTSVLDVGCGTGNFLKIFQDRGISDVLGLDGNWVAADQLFIEEKYFKAIDLQKPFVLSRQFDLAICLEVAEHLPATSADHLVSSLCAHSDTIVFSAAVPYQGGQNHINEQPFTYWKKRFENHGYQWLDPYRSWLWQLEELAWWYKQNLFLITKKQDLITAVGANTRFADLVLIHPDLFAERNSNLEFYGKHYRELYESMLEGKFQLSTYITAILRNIKRKLNKL